MNALLALIPITLVLAAAAVGVFFWAVRHDQFEDLDTPGVVPLLDQAPEESSADDDVEPSVRDPAGTTPPSTR